MQILTVKVSILYEYVPQKQHYPFFKRTTFLYQLVAKTPFFAKMMRLCTAAADMPSRPGSLLRHRQFFLNKKTTTTRAVAMSMHHLKNRFRHQSKQLY